MRKFVSTNITPWVYELKYDLFRQFRSKIALLINILANIGVYGLIVLVNDSNAISKWYDVSAANEGMLVLIGYTYWQFSYFIIQVNVFNISGEYYSGILEAKLLTKSNFVFLMFARIISNLAICLIAQLCVVVFASLFNIIHITQIVKYLFSVLIYAPALLGIFGWAVIFGGITLKIKVMGQFMYVLSGIMLIFSSVYNINSNYIQYLFPFALGIDISREIYLNLPVSIYEWLQYISLNVFYLFAGIVGFNRLLKSNKRNGCFSA